MDIYLSHDFILQSLSGSDEVLKQMRADSETYDYSYSLGARFGFTFPSGMGIKTGLNYSKVNISMNYDDTDGPLDTMNVISLTNNNSYTYIDIPLLFSYEMAGIGSFYYNINAGFIFNMILTPEGKFITPSGKTRYFTKGATERYDAYKKDAGTALYVSFGFHYVYNKLIDFVIEPNIKYAISPISLNEYSLNEKHTSLGLITGIRYKF